MGYLVSFHQYSAFCHASIHKRLGDGNSLYQGTASAKGIREAVELAAEQFAPEKAHKYAVSLPSRKVTINDL